LALSSSLIVCVSQSVTHLPSCHHDPWSSKRCSTQPSVCHLWASVDTPHCISLSLSLPLSLSLSRCPPLPPLCLSLSLSPSRPPSPPLSPPLSLLPLLSTRL